MKAVITKIKDAFCGKQSTEGMRVDHPNFWMYQ